MLAVVPAAVGACGSTSGSPSTLTGQTSFVSAPFNGQSSGSSNSGAGGLSAAAPTAGAATNTAAGSSTTPTRTVQETDLYRLDGDRLYYLNSYRGLMVFDVTNVDAPKFLGRSAIFGDPVDMVVSNGIATVVVGDWYGTLSDGSPFHGSVVRGLDATDPTNITVIGDVKVNGWVQEDRVVGNVLYLVSQDYGWEYGWGVGVLGGGVGAPGVALAGGAAVGGGVAIASSTNSSSVIVSSVNFANGQVTAVSSPSYNASSGVFNVTPNAIMLASANDTGADGGTISPTQTTLQYLDITDPGGLIKPLGSIQVDGVIQTSGADNGRWSLDFADGTTAHVIGYSATNTGSTNSYILATANFANPSAPTLDSELTIPGQSWTPTALFQPGRMYLSPDADYYSPSATTTPLQVFDLSNPAAPVLAGSTPIPGSVSILIPSGNQLFALGNSTTQNASMSLNYIDVTNAASPALIGTSTFGEGWATTPATGTFKAFTLDTTDGLVVLPFSGWDASSGAYNNGVQLVEFTPTTITTAGAAHTHGWVERGIIVNGRIVSLSDLALSVVNYSNPLSPTVTAELTLARSVISAQPTGATIAEVSSDFWDNDVSHSDVRVLPITDAEENLDESNAVDTQIPGVGANVFTNGNFDYILTSVQVSVPCGGGTPVGPVGVGLVAGGAASSPGSPTAVDAGVTSDAGAAPTQQCTGWQEQVQVVDLSNGGARVRGTAQLPIDPNYYYSGWGWYGCYAWDWYNGAEVVQVGDSALAFRRWTPNYTNNGTWVDASSDLYIVDLSKPDAPTVASMIVTNDPTGWWGDMQVIGSTLYTIHSEWVDSTIQQATTRYYLDRIDLSDLTHPKIESSINVPGALVGGSPTDPSILYTMDYDWDGTIERDYLDVVQVAGNLAYLQSKTELDGYVGNVIVQGTTAYMSSQIYSDKLQSGQPTMVLHQIDLSKPQSPVDHVASGPGGWGWLLAVEGDRALVTSGWGGDGLDVYKLTSGAPPAYDQFVLTRGWSINTLSRQNNQIFLSSGYWGVQAVTLQ